MTRLIDADVMIDILRKSHESHATNSREENLLDRDIRLVKEQEKYHPVIIEQRPHGEWLECEDKRYCECSICWVLVTKKEAEDFDYCPKCGSDNRKRSEAE